MYGNQMGDGQSYEQKNIIGNTSPSTLAHKHILLSFSATRRCYESFNVAMFFHSYYGALITCSLVQPDALSKHGFDALLRESVWLIEKILLKIL